MQTNVYHQIIAWNHIIVNKLLALDRNTWNHKIIIIITWNHINAFVLFVLIICIRLQFLIYFVYFKVCLATHCIVRGQQVKTKLIYKKDKFLVNFEGSKCSLRETEDYYDWHHIVIHIFRSLLLLDSLTGAQYGTNSQPKDYQLTTQADMSTLLTADSAVSIITYFLDAYTFWFRYNSRDSFPLSHVYLNTQVHILFTKSTLTLICNAHSISHSFLKKSRNILESQFLLQKKTISLNGKRWISLSHNIYIFINIHTYMLM